MSLALDTELSSGTPLDLADAHAVRAAADRLVTAVPEAVDHPDWVTAAREAWDVLPVALRRRVRAFRRHSGPSGVLLLRGLPVDEPSMPPTPTRAGSVQRTPSVPAAVLMMIASGLGEPAAYRPEKSGALVQDVVPVPGQETVQGNSGSSPLTFHNENAFHDHRPDYVMLLCLRRDHDGMAGLRTSSVRQALPLLADDVVETLFRPEFVTQAPPSFGGTTGSGEWQPVLSGAADDPDVRVDFAATTPLSPAAAAAVAELARAFEAVAIDHVLSPGDLAVVDNRVAVHGRTAFRPRYDGKDRWLQRTFVLADLRRSRAYRPADGHRLTR